MSTPIGNNLARFMDAPCSKRIVVNREQQEEGLADYVRRLRHEKDLSLADVSNRSGGGIGRTHINRIENGEAHGVSVEKLRALAKGLGVLEEEIFAVARGKTTSGELTFDELRMLELYRKLSPEKRIEAIAHLEVVFQYQAGGHEPRRQPATSTATGSSKRSEKKRA